MVFWWQFLRCQSYESAAEELSPSRSLAEAERVFGGLNSLLRDLPSPSPVQGPSQSQNATKPCRALLLTPYEPCKLASISESFPMRALCTSLPPPYWVILGCGSCCPAAQQSPLQVAFTGVIGAGMSRQFCLQRLVQRTLKGDVGRQALSPNRG